MQPGATGGVPGLMDAVRASIGRYLVVAIVGTAGVLVVVDSSRRETACLQARLDTIDLERELMRAELERIQRSRPG